MHPAPCALTRIVRRDTLVRNAMDESILIRFEVDGRPLKVISFNARQGVEFEEPRDASPLNLAFGIQALFPSRLDPVRLRHDWRNKEFNLDARVEDGGLLFSGYHGDREGLPFGPYDINVEVESYRFRNAQQRIILHRGARAEVLLRVEPDRRRVRLLNNFDGETARVLDASRMEGEPLRDWLINSKPRPARQACLLNVLTKLAERPEVSTPIEATLTRRIRSLYFADVDRAYAAADPRLAGDLEALVQAQLWVKEGPPKADIHRRLLNTLTQFGVSEEDASRFDLLSYRQGGRNSLQAVIATAPLGFAHAEAYVDLDIDLGNPLWDLEGFCVHLGELLDPGRTDHFALHDKLRRNPETGDFVFYEIVTAGTAMA